MTTFFAAGSATTEWTDADLRAALASVLSQLGSRERVLAIPPDHTRDASYAGPLTCMAHELLQDSLVDVMPAIGTHAEMRVPQLQKMFPSLPLSLIRYHDWRNDVITIGEVPSEFVSEATGGIYERPWPAQLNKLVWEGDHDLILSIGQVVPHEVIGMANHNKNLFVGTGGSRGINESHFIGAVYGMERMMGRADTPLRRILNRAEQLFCERLPVVYVLTVVGTLPDGRSVVRGLFIGDDTDCFEQAAALAVEVNFTQVAAPLKKVVVRMDSEKFKSTWLANKAIYRTRMAIADDGELIVIAPQLEEFGEDPTIDRLIRKFGYRTTPEILAAVDREPELRDNLSAAAHLIHGSSEGRFRVTYCPGHVSEQEITSVGYSHMALTEAERRYPKGELNEGFNTGADGEEFFFIANPALGLWAHPSRMM